MKNMPKSILLANAMSALAMQAIFASEISLADNERERE